MINLPGYEVKEKIFKSINSTVYRGLCKSDNSMVIIKVMNNEYPTSEELASFRREYEIINKISGDRVIKVYNIDIYNNGLAIIMEDVKGKSLADILKANKMSLTEKLRLAINITEAIMQIHKHNIIHKDITPSNIIFNIENNDLRIIDFGISTGLSMEKPQNLSTLEGTIPYISPEQTGKVNRIVDYRSDFYSLGVMLYEIFTGQLPFTGDDSEVVYSHIAKIPMEPKLVNTEVPPAVSDIIMKLMAKNAEDRYQNILGLKHDLMYCLENLKYRDRIIEFQIGQKDISDRFQIPQKLYGREFELKTLKKSFEGLYTNEIKLLLISGYSGIGKTSVVMEMHKAIIDKGGYFISGKFSQLERNNPYSAIISAFKGLIKNLVSEYKNIELLKYRLTEALGSNGKIMVDLIPELKQIIGEQPDIPLLNPIEEKNRFQMIFRDFIKVFAQKNHPLVLFLDDLQWSDFSTMDFLKYILASQEVHNLLIVGAFRDNEVGEGHPLVQMLNEVKNAIGGTNFLNHLVLQPLDENAVNQMVSDTLNRSNSDTSQLSSYIHRKTKGNPFFVSQLLISLYQKSILKFNEDKLQWNWNLDEAEKFQISNNVVDFLIETLNELPKDSLEVIKTASCLGNCFDLKTLYLISNELENISDALWIAIKKDFIVPANNKYKLLHMPKEEFVKSNIEIKFRFSHDRICQSAYSLISENERVMIHRKIGTILFDAYKDENNIESNIFEMINHMNIAKDLIENQDERIGLANLNYTAGIKAKANSAYDIAANYFITGKTLLSSEEWKQYPGKLFALSYELTETSFLGGKVEEAFELCTYLLDTATNIIEKARVYALKAKILDLGGEKREIVIDEIRKALKLLDFDLPQDISQIDQKFGESIGKIAAYLGKYQIEDLINLPKMTDENKIMMMNLLFQVQPAAFQSYPPLNFLIQLTMFDMALTYGTTEVSTKSYTECGIILGSILGNFEMAYKLNQVAFALLEKYKARSLEAGCYFIFAAFISHWRAHYSESLDYYDLSVKRGLETGDIEHASYSCSHKVHRNLYVGTNLDNCKSEANNAIKLLKETKVSLLVPLVEVFIHTINQLQSAYDFKSEESLLADLYNSNNLFILCTFGQCNLMVNYILGNLEAAKRWNFFTDPYLQGGTGFFPIPDHCMFQSLLLAKMYDKADENEKGEIIESITKNMEKLMIWSDNCPSNFSHKYYLVSAELAKIQNEPQEKITGLYKTALNSIASGEFTHMRAIINELIGEFWIGRDEELIAKVYIKEAYYFYKLWGAASKVKIIEDKYRRFFSDNRNLEIESSGSRGQATSSKFTEVMSLDLGYILKTTQAIASEIKIDKLLKVLMRTIIESTGAQLGCLILKKGSNGSLYVEAQKNMGSEEIDVLKSIPLDMCNDFCPQIVQYVVRTRENVVIDDAKNNLNFQNNEYIGMRNIKSVLCMPIVFKDNLSGVVYLENNLMENIFTLNRVETLKIILSQIAISIENAQLYESLEEKVRERTFQLETANNELKDLSLHDPLTKLYNRRYLYEFISDLSDNFIKAKTALFFNRQKRDLSVENNVIGVFLIDIDFFKSVNDVYGHSAGDAVLVKIAKALKSILRDDDYIIRWGGEEFLIILNKSKVEYLKVFSKKVLDLMRNTPIEISDNKIIYKTCSIGCTHLPFEPGLPDLLTLEQNINICDFAMYKAKKSGRNRAIHISPQQSGSYTGEELKRYILDLTDGSDIDERYVSIEEVT
ncbi:MAG TPA: diguanylate cyclase [Pseudobacteroides sp.]|uniref:protein kinase domain-containing protein n=1 Tax=Pseudobacteroides sp. TaxID=1968840 RepID=UPI002F95E833